MNIRKVIRSVPFALITLLAPFLAAGENFTNVVPLTNTLAVGTRRDATVDQLFAQWNHKGSSGAAVVIIKDGAVIYECGYGYANLEHSIPITPQTVFEAGSVAKQFTGLAVAMLMEQGKLSLDDDIRRYLPDVPDFGKPIVIRNLLYHTSGLRDWAATLALSDVNFQGPITSDMILEMVRRQRELNFSPGEEWSYSNTGYNLLAAIVAKVTGKTFPAWTDENIFQPLGMKHTAVRTDPAEVIPNLADSYEPNTAGKFHRINSQTVTPGSGGLMITAEDIGKWLVNFETKRVGGKTAIERMQQPGTLNNGEKVNYGFGVVPDDFRGTASIYHFGTWAGYRSFVMWIPQKRFAFAILSNAGDLKVQPLIRKLLDHYLGPEPGAPASSSPDKPAAAVKADPATWDDFPGTYRLGCRRFLIITREEDRLMARGYDEPNIAMTPISDGSFLMGTNRTVVEFVRQAPGLVTNLVYGDIRAPKLDLSQSTPSHLAKLAGDYWSEELRIVVRLELHAGKLATQLRSGEWFYFLPTGPDSFDGYGDTIEFTRNSASEPIEFKLSGDRARNIRYTRVVLSGPNADAVTK